MIAYTGFRGDGKTLSAVAQLKKDFGKNSIFFTNTPLYFDKLRLKHNNNNIYFYRSLSILEEWYRFAMFNREVVMQYETIFFIDEAHLLLHAREFKNLSSTMREFLAQSRKINCEIYITAQSIHKVDKELRTLIEECVRCTRGFLGLYIEQERFALDLEGLPDPAAKTMRSNLWLPKRHFQNYDTNYIVQTDGSVPPTNPDFFSTIYAPHNNVVL